MTGEENEEFFNGTTQALKVALFRREHKISRYNDSVQQLIQRDIALYVNLINASAEKFLSRSIDEWIQQLNNESLLKYKQNL